MAAASVFVSWKLKLTRINNATNYLCCGNHLMCHSMIAELAGTRNSEKKHYTENFVPVLNVQTRIRTLLCRTSYVIYHWAGPSQHASSLHIWLRNQPCYSVWCIKHSLTVDYRYTGTMNKYRKHCAR